jgi:hypothetical protein
MKQARLKPAFSLRKRFTTIREDGRSLQIFVCTFFKTRFTVLSVSLSPSLNSKQI